MPSVSESSPPWCRSCSMTFMRVTEEELTTAIPHAEHQILPGQTHDVDPKVVAPVLTAFSQS